MGARRHRDGQYEGWRINSRVIEGAVADLMAMIRVVGRVGAVDYEVRIGIEWTGDEPLMFYYQERLIDLDTEAGVIPIHRFAVSPVDLRRRCFPGLRHRGRRGRLDCWRP